MLENNFFLPVLMLASVGSVVMPQMTDIFILGGIVLISVLFIIRKILNFLTKGR